MEVEAVSAGIIAVGDEVLRGDTHDTNTHFLCRELYQRGVEVRRCMVIPDVHDEIVHHVREGRELYDWLVVSGGIGPTPDDLTRQAVADALGDELVLRDDAVEEYRRRRSAVLNAGQLEMCRLPRSAELVWSEFASPPGFILSGVLVLPGVPQILKSMWEAAAPRFHGTPLHNARFNTMLGESRWAHIMASYIEQYPQLKFGSYPKMESIWRVEVRVEGRDREEVRHVALLLEQEISKVG